MSFERAETVTIPGIYQMIEDPEKQIQLTAERPFIEWTLINYLRNNYPFDCILSYFIKQGLVFNPPRDSRRMLPGYGVINVVQSGEELVTIEHQAFPVTLAAGIPGHEAVINIKDVGQPHVLTTEVIYDPSDRDGNLAFILRHGRESSSLWDIYLEFAGSNPGVLILASADWFNQLHERQHFPLWKEKSLEQKGFFSGIFRDIMSFYGKIPDYFRF